MSWQFWLWPRYIFRAIKVWVFRKYYRLSCAWGWRGHVGDAPHSTFQIPVEGRYIAVRMYADGGRRDRPMIIYFHGGGWVIGDLNTHHPFCQALNARTGCTVMAVDYSLAPERPFPAAQVDALVATRWIAQRATQIGPSNGQLVIAGDSAGAQLATCTCLDIDSPTREQIVGEFLIYPATDHYTAGFDSYVEKAKGQTLTANIMHWFWDTYLGDYAADDPLVERARPLRFGDLAALPPTLLVTAENDPLRDEGRAYADTLHELEVPIDYLHFDMTDHGFICAEGPTANLDEVMDHLIAWLQHLD